MAAPCPPSDVDRAGQSVLDGDSVRQIVHLSIGGLAARVMLSNAYGKTPLLVQSVYAAPVERGSDVQADAMKPVLFGGKTEVTIAPGQDVTSDAVNEAVTAGEDFAVSFFVPGKISAPAVHYTALQTSYVIAGDQAATAVWGKPRKITMDLIVMGIDVASRTSTGAIVALGSSTTDGAHSSMDQNHRWTDWLIVRMQQADGASAPAVLNAGISGNKVLRESGGEWGETFGVSALSRFHRDVLGKSGLKWVVVFEGGNDIRQAGAGDSPLDWVSSGSLIKAFSLMAREAHARKLKIIFGTITPSSGNNPNKEVPAWEASRREVNDWIRTSKEIDGYVDFDKATRDPHDPARLLPALDSGDHLHMNDAGYKAMADSIDLNLFGQ